MNIYFTKKKKNQKDKKKRKKNFLQRESNPGTLDTVGLRVFSAIAPR